MNEIRLLSSTELESSPVVANCYMNRERDLLGTNGYEFELGFEPFTWLRNRLAMQRVVRWLDLCCGTGKAVIQAARMIDLADGIGSADGGGGSIQITGVDLVGMFMPHSSDCLKLVQGSVFDYAPAERFDLVTCVHGLHYLGDKLRAVGLAASWLVSDGLFAANLDARNLCLSERSKGHCKIVRWLRDEGFEYSPRKHLLQRNGHTNLNAPFRYLGADDSAGPNYTKQPVVTSFYK